MTTINNIFASLAKEPLFSTVVLNNSPSSIQINNALKELETKLIPFLFLPQISHNFFKALNFAQRLSNLPNFQYVHISFFNSLINYLKNLSPATADQESLLFNLVGSPNPTSSLSQLLALYSKFLISEFKNPDLSKIDDITYTNELISMYPPKAMSCLSASLESVHCDSTSLSEISLFCLSIDGYLKFYNASAPLELLNLINSLYIGHIEPLKHTDNKEFSSDLKITHPLQVKHIIFNALKSINEFNNASLASPTFSASSISYIVPKQCFDNLITQAIINFSNSFASSNYFHLSVEEVFAISLEDAITSSFTSYAATQPKFFNLSSSNVSPSTQFSQEYAHFYENFISYAATALKPQLLSTLETDFCHSSMAISKPNWLTLFNIEPHLKTLHVSEVEKIKTSIHGLNSETAQLFLNNTTNTNASNDKSNLEDKTSRSSFIIQHESAVNIINNLLIQSCLYASINNLDIKSLNLIYKSFNQTTNLLSLPVHFLITIAFSNSVNPKLLTLLPEILDVLIQNSLNSPYNSSSDFLTYASSASDFGEFYQAFEVKNREFEKLPASIDDIKYKIRRILSNRSYNQFTNSFLEDFQNKEQIKNAFIDSLLIGNNKKQSVRHYVLTSLMNYPEFKEKIGQRASILIEKLNAYNNTAVNKEEFEFLQKVFIDLNLSNINPPENKKSNNINKI